ncbi:hypothetical protein KEH59_02785 [Burkholderia contaminans]|uniref:hypothetical protein n=1 Tax=Burkholderia contaminans TaxID=488447 RepID=UPI001BADE98E|nr:hypothetical protein [Burkholderia contaminans]QUN46461.1 hypothetical protein KEH59_02785 [Burkholderia contaminans]
MAIVEPGAFRTGWAGRSMVESPIRIDDYVETAGKRRAATRAVAGKQPGGPARAALAIIAAYEAAAPPLRLLLGGAALKVAPARFDALRDFQRVGGNDEARRRSGPEVIGRSRHVAIGVASTKAGLKLERVPHTLNDALGAVTDECSPHRGAHSDDAHQGSFLARLRSR